MNNVKKLPDAYLKRYENGEKSNHAKMLELNELQRDEFKQNMEAVLECLDIDKATGVTLDRYGEILNQKRGELNDIQYRIMLRFKIAKYLSQGDYNSIMPLIRFLLGCKKDDVFIMRDMNIEDILSKTKTNGTVEITNLPLAVMINAGFTSEQVIQLIEELLPAGVRVSRANFLGTFILSGEELEESNTEGFADIDETKGGYLGLVLVDEKPKVDLPT